jgi:PAS domain S-box-containing protein
MPNLWGLFHTGDFMPHGMCYLWNPALVRLHFISDLLIGLAYVAISVVLARFSYRARRDVPLSWVVLGFGAFIIACGATHFMEVWTLWTPLYWVSGAIKAVTAAASVTVALVLPRVLPKAMAMIRSAGTSGQRELDLQVANEALRTEISSKREERKFRQFLESAPDAMVVMNPEGAIVLVNAELERMFGYQRQELLHQPMETLMPAGLLDRLPGNLSSFNQPRLRVMGPGLELFGRRKDGTEFPVEISLSPLETEDGMLVSSAIRDISERKRSEREIVDLNVGLATRNVELATSVHELAASVQELEAFTSSVAHDLRAPLRHIQAFSTTLTESLAPQTDPASQALLHQIVDTTHNMAKMVDDLLSLARLGRQELSPQVTGLNSLVQEVIKYLTPELKERQIDWQFGDLPFVDCDAGLIKQVFFNLLSNALKYTMPRKPAVIEIGCRIAESPPVFFVKDNGVGFNMKYADKLFGVFQRLHRREDFEGVGVGLASAQRIIHKHGGRIWAEAEVDKGATFFFTLSPRQVPETKLEQVLIEETSR